MALVRKPATFRMIRQRFNSAYKAIEPFCCCRWVEFGDELKLLF
jgi:hypothetical protein